MRKLATSELKRPGISEFKNAEHFPLVVVLDNVRSAYNVGAVFRTCDAFAVEKILLCGISAAPPNREVLKTAIGSTESVEWKYHADSYKAVQVLKEEGCKIILVEQTDESIPLQNFFLTQGGKYALVFGNEVNGISDNVLSLADHAIEIPQFGTKHSFNISVAAGIVLWHLHSMHQR